MLQNLLLNIDAGTIDWSRAQFALTAIYHWLFVPLTLGLAVIMGIAETKYYRTKDEFWKTTAKFWQRLFGINFAMGVATGIILEFEFGTNWSNYSWFVGDIFGAPLAVEGIVAFFMESTFVAVMFFGWKKVSAGFHLASTWLTGLGATISAWWILVANAWMQYPVGCEFNPDTMRNEMVSFAEVALSPFAVSKFCHTVTSAWIIGAIFCVGVCCWYLLKKQHTRLAIESMKIGAAVGLVAALLAGATGHKSGMDVAKVQPMKLAAMEALYDGGTEVGLKLVEGIEVPYGLSIMATNDPKGYVPGINDILNGYTMVGVGCLFILFFAVILAVVYRWPKFLFGKRDITALPAWHYWVAILLIPLGYVGSECGWLVAEFGRQPWTIQDMLPTWASVSDIQASNVAITFFLFLVLFTTMLAVEINILLKQIKKGPEL